MLRVSCGQTQQYAFSSWDLATPFPFTESILFGTRHSPCKAFWFPWICSMQLHQGDSLNLQHPDERRL